jgi:IS30 family transposase
MKIIDSVKSNELIKEISEFQHKINERPRQKLNFDLPKNIFYKFINGNVAFGT